MTTEETLNKLTAFRRLEKFSSSAWLDRGLNPSGSQMCLELEELFNASADHLMEAASAGASPGQFKRILKERLSHFDSFNYDTEEREFICDYFYQLSNIVGVDFKENLNRWLYGKTMSFLLKVASLFRPAEKVLETFSQDCTNCKAKLETFITKKQDGIQSASWMIVQCTNCKEFNLIESPPDALQMKFGNYKWVEPLSKDQYTEEQARIRFEQIKLYRRR